MNYVRITVSSDKREADEKMESGLEAATYREAKSRLERSVARNYLTTGEWLDSRLRGNDPGEPLSL
jgi:hypothetical protein